MRLSKRFKKHMVSVMVATMMLSGANYAPFVQTVYAQKVPGEAAFINTWLVAGPFDAPIADEIYDTVTPENPNLVPKSKVTASSQIGASNPPEHIYDGSTKKQWVSAEGDLEPWLNLAWEEPVTVGTISITQWGDGRHVNKHYTLTFTLEDGTVTEPVEVSSTSGDPAKPTLYDLEVPVQNVKEMKIEIDKGLTGFNITGVSEVEVYQYAAETMQLAEMGSITPKIGEGFGNEAESKNWEYFDDRIFNRNYDDYQDLYGYYTVKKGIETRELDEKGKVVAGDYVYAHTYVYSPVEQNVQFRFGTTGRHKLFVNDKMVVRDTESPAEVQKDMVKQDITLKQGWNKILLQVKHEAVSFLGFYGRITDTNGNEVPGLTYSVTGNTGGLAIDTQGLKSKDMVQDAQAVGRGLPTNELPNGYVEWPYVWNESKYNNAHSIDASKFSFTASGGVPGYTWQVICGNLPEGLTLNEDGTIEGFATKEGNYDFVLKVTDSVGNTALKDFTITVNERPNKWFEEGRVSALSHCVPVYKWFVDSNYSADLWAQRAKAQGHSIVNIESLQQNYYWPSKFEDPNHARGKYLPRDEEGKVLDGLKEFEEAVKRYDMKFGIYYATEGGGLQHYSTDIFVQNVEDLILRYEPDHLYFDGPQAMPGANYDVMFSNVRNYSNEILINSNAWYGEYGDADLRTTEAGHLFGGGRGTNFTKRTINEPWKSQVTKNNPTPYYGHRDDFRLLVKEMVMNIGKGFVDNVDQMPTMNRGSNWDSPEYITDIYPKQVQEFIDVREGIAGWFAPEGKPERHESTTGTMPYFLDSDGCNCTDDGKGNIDHFENNHGVKWGYSTARDNNIYLHILEGCGGRIGYSGDSLTITPVKDSVERVTYLNEDQELPFTQDGESVTIDLTGVERDAVDTIIKLVTDNTQRDYKLTNVTTSAKPLTDTTLKIIPDTYMTYPALKAPGTVVFESSDESIATVDENGVVTAGVDGRVSITTQVTYEGVTAEDTLEVKVKDGKLYVAEKMIGATILAGGKETYGEFSSRTPIEYTVEGRSEKGGAIGLVGANVKMKAGLVTASDSKKQPVQIEEADVVVFSDGKIIPKPVEEKTKIAVWAEVELDGQSFTTNKVFMDLYPTANLSPKATVTASDNVEGYTSDKVIDGKLILGDGTDDSKWSVNGEGESWIAFDLQNKMKVQNVEIHFNSLNQKYFNTPQTMEIQASQDGENWTTASNVSNLPKHGSTEYYFGFSDTYTLEQMVDTRYVRLLFPEGGQKEVIDLLEVKVNGVDTQNLLTDVKITPELIDNQTAELNLSAFNGAGNEMDMAEAKVLVTSSHPEYVSVDQDNRLKAGAPGKARIDVTVIINGMAVNNYIYVDTDSEGNIQFNDYLVGATLQLNQSTIDVGAPVKASFEGVLNTGETVKLEEAEIEYLLGDSRLQVREGSHTIELTEEIARDKMTKVKAVVTLDGVAVETNEVNLKMLGNSIVSSAKVEVSSVRDRNGVPDGNDADSRYTADKAVDGDINTQWACKKVDPTPWIELTWDTEQLISSVVLRDRINPVDDAVGGTLTFSDGTQIDVTGIPTDGAPKEIKLDKPIQATWVKFEIDRNQSRGKEVGLSEIDVVRVKPEQKQGLTLSGNTSVKAGEELTVGLGVAGMGENIYAQDITLKYDPESFVLEEITANGTHEIAGIKRNDAEGTATVLVASPDGVEMAADILNIVLRAKETETDKETAITVDGKLGVVEEGVSTTVEVDTASHNVKVEAGKVESVDKAALEAAIQSAEELHNNAEEGTRPGQYPEGSKAKLMTAIEAAKVIMNNATTQMEVDEAVVALNKAVQEFTDSKIEDTSEIGDINKDGKIDVADLGLVAYYYMAKVGDDNWDKAQVADVAKNGAIDIGDLSFVANKILEK